MDKGVERPLDDAAGWNGGRRPYAGSRAGPAGSQSQSPCKLTVMTDTRYAVSGQGPTPVAPAFVTPRLRALSGLHARQADGSGKFQLWQLGRLRAMLRLGRRLGLTPASSLRMASEAKRSRRSARPPAY